MLKRLFQLPLNSKDSFFIFGPRGTGKCFVLYLGEHALYLENDITVLPFVEGLKKLDEWVGNG